VLEFVLLQKTARAHFHGKLCAAFHTVETQHFNAESPPADDLGAIFEVALEEMQGGIVGSVREAFLG
jgi:hypothetical protein